MQRPACDATRSAHWLPKLPPSSTSYDFHTPGNVPLRSSSPKIASCASTPASAPPSGPRSLSTHRVRMRDQQRVNLPESLLRPVLHRCAPERLAALFAQRHQLAHSLSRAGTHVDDQASCPTTRLIGWHAQYGASVAPNVVLPERVGRGRERRSAAVAALVGRGEAPDRGHCGGGARSEQVQLQLARVVCGHRHDEAGQRCNEARAGKTRRGGSAAFL